MKYQLRTDANPKNPADRGRLVAEYQYYVDAFRHWQRLNAAGDKAAVVVKVA